MNVTSSLGVVIVSYSLNTMAASGTSDVWSEEDESLPSVDSESEGDYGNVDLHANLPYQDEPLAVPGQPPAFTFDEDPDGIPHDVLAAREEGQIRLGNWYVSSNVLSNIYM